MGCSSSKMPGSGRPLGLSIRVRFRLSCALGLRPPYVVIIKNTLFFVNRTVFIATTEPLLCNNAIIALKVQRKRRRRSYETSWEKSGTSIDAIAVVFTLPRSCRSSCRIVVYWTPRLFGQRCSRWRNLI